MEYSKFERHIADVLKNDELTLDINALISDIHSKQKNRRRIAFWFWVTACSFVVVLGLAFILQNIKAADETNKIAADILSPKLRDGGNNKNAPTSENEALLLVPDPENLGVKDKMESEKAAIIKHSQRKANQQFNQNYNKTDKEKASSPHFQPYGKKENETSHEILSKTDHISLLDGINTKFGYERQVPSLKWNTDKVQCPSFSNKNKWFVELIPEAGIFMPLKKLESSTAEPENIYARRNDYEKSLEGIQAALYVQLKKQNSPLYLKGGISWSKLSERMSLQYAYTKRDTTRGIISITVSQTGDTVTTIYGDIVTERKLSGNKTKHYSISLVDFPIGIGAEKRFGRWFGAVEGGVMLNIGMNTTGNILASDTSFTAINVNSGHFKNTLGLSYFAGILGGVDLYNAGRIYIAARARFIPETFSPDQNPIRQRYNFAGLNVGYVYTF